MVNKKLWFLRENVFLSIPIISSLIERNRYVSFFQGGAISCDNEMSLFRGIRDFSVYSMFIVNGVGE